MLLHYTANGLKIQPAISQHAHTVIFFGLCLSSCSSPEHSHDMWICSLDFGCASQALTHKPPIHFRLPVRLPDNPESFHQNHDEMNCVCWWTDATHVEECRGAQTWPEPILDGSQGQHLENQVAPALLCIELQLYDSKSLPPQERFCQLTSIGKSVLLIAKTHKLTSNDSKLNYHNPKLQNYF